VSKEKQEDEGASQKRRALIPEKPLIIKFSEKYFIRD
jgi:hypothetical protein